MSTTKLTPFVSYNTEVEHKEYLKEVKDNNIAVIGGVSESPLDVGTYKVSVVGGNDSKHRITGITNNLAWALFLIDVKVIGGTFAGRTDRIPFSPETTYKKNARLNVEIYLDKKGLKRGKIVE